MHSSIRMLPLIPSFSKHFEYSALRLILVYLVCLLIHSMHMVRWFLLEENSCMHRTHGMLVLSAAECFVTFVHSSIRHNVPNTHLNLHLNLVILSSLGDFDQFELQVLF